MNKINNKFKKPSIFKLVCTLLASVSILFGSFNCPAPTTSGTFTNGTTLAGNTGNSVFTNGAAIYKISVTSTNSAAAFLRFYDSPSSAITNLQSAYTNTTIVQSNHVVTYTNIMGRTNNFTNTVIARTSSITAASLVAYPIFYDFTIPAGTNTVIFEPSNPMRVFLGLMATNSLPLQYVIEYAQTP